MAAVSKSEWGTKRACLSCGTKFYDLRRNPITCPSCSAIFVPEAASRSRRARSAPPPSEEPPPKEPPPKQADAEVEGTPKEAGETDIEIIETEETEKDDDPIEDPSELGEDDDDMAEVIDVMEVKEES